MTVRRITNEAEAQLLYDFAVANYQTDLSQFCLDAPPYPTLGQLQQWIRVGWPVYLLENAGQSEGFMTFYSSGVLSWVVMNTRPDFLAARPESVISALTELLTFAGRDMGKLGGPETPAVRDQPRTNLETAYDRAKAAFAAAGDAVVLA